MTDAEYKAQQAEAKSKIKQLGIKKRKNPDDFSKADRDNLIKLQKFRTSLSPSKKAQVKKNIGTATDIGLTALTFVPGLGALGLGARAIMKGIQAGKTVYKVGSKTFKSKNAAVDAAKKIKAPLKPKATGRLSAEARGREHIQRRLQQRQGTSKVRSAATRGITKTAAQKEALKTSAKRSAAGAAGLGAISATAAITKEKNKVPKVPVIKAPKEPFKVKPKLTYNPKVPAPKIAPPPSKSYTVKGGDTLSQIAKRTGTTLKALLKANPNIDKPNEIRVGQKIKLSKPVKGRKSVYQGMSKSAMAKIHKGPPPIKKPARLKMQAGGRMSRVGLSPAEMARAGTMSEAKRKRYMAKGGLVKRKHAGKVGPKEQDYRDRKDESIGIRLGKGKATQKNPNKAAKERNLSYGKYGKGTGKGKINRSGGDAYVAKGYA